MKGEWEGCVCVVTLRRWVLAATPLAWIMAMNMGMSPSGLPFPPAILMPNASVGPCGETHTYTHTSCSLTHRRSFHYHSVGAVLEGMVGYLTRVISTVRRPVSTIEMTQKKQKINSVQICMTYDILPNDNQRSNKFIKG